MRSKEGSMRETFDYLLKKVMSILSKPMSVFIWLITPGRFSTFQRYTIAILIVGAMTLLTWVSRLTFGARYIYIMYYSGVILAALVGGTGPGLLATATSAVAASHFFIEPRTSLLIADPRDVAVMAIFCFNGFLMTIIVDRVRKAKAEQVRQEVLTTANRQLEARVQERTEELQGAYDNLVKETKQRRQAEERLWQAQKMEAIGGLAAGVAHDFNNMLAVIVGNAELALDDITEQSPRENIKQILNASKRSRDLVRQILTFSRKGQGERRPLKLVEIVEETTRLLRGSLPTNIKLETRIDDDSAPVLADPSQVQQVLMNLSRNAVHAMGEDGGTLTISLSGVTFDEQNGLPDPDLEPGRYVKLAVRDTGTGIPDEICHRVFDPFFTTKGPGEGTGMGLAVAFGIVKSHLGAITVESEVGKGTTFNVFFPESRESFDEEERFQTAGLPKGDESILVVDDEPSVLNVVSKTLTRLGYEVTTASGGLEGWRRFADNPDVFDLILADQVMPEMTGMRLVEKMLKIRSDLPIILFTGYSATVSPEKAQAAGVRGFLMKPVMKEQLADTVRRVLDSRKAA